jgi:hypothetical protein
MTRPFITKKITTEELTNIELKNEAVRHKGNLTLKTYRMDVDRELQHKSKCEEVLYVGDQRMAAVTWEETVHLGRIKDIVRLNPHLQILRLL